MPHDLARTVQIALLGEVPPTLRFLYVGPADESIKIHAVFLRELNAIISRIADERLRPTKHSSRRLRRD